MGSENKTFSLSRQFSRTSWNTKYDRKGWYNWRVRIVAVLRLNHPVLTCFMTLRYSWSQKEQNFSSTTFLFELLLNQEYWRTNRVYHQTSSTSKPLSNINISALLFFLTSGTRVYMKLCRPKLHDVLSNNWTSQFSCFFDHWGCFQTISLQFQISNNTCQAVEHLPSRHRT